MEKGKLNSNKYEEILVYEILLFKLDMVILKDSIKVQYQTNSISKNQFEASYIEINFGKNL